MVNLTMAELGTNVDAHATFQPPDIAASGARWQRTIGLLHVDLTDWLMESRLLGLKTFMVFGSESLGFESGGWAERIAEFVARYRGLLDGWQFCNEPDAGWTPGDDCPPIEDRRRDHESSWVQEPEAVEFILEEARRQL